MIQLTASNTNSHECEGDDDAYKLNENDTIADDSNIFQANEINMFGETVYISYKCYQNLMESIDASGMSTAEIVALKEQMRSELPMLHDF